MPDDEPGIVEGFISRWDGTERAERANKDAFLIELCAVLGVPVPDAAAGRLGAYRFERAVTHYADDGSAKPRFIDLYKRGCFVLEAKQGSNPHRQGSLFGNEAEHRTNVRGQRGWSSHMLAAKGQAERYARDLPADEGWPPFLIVCDVGFCLDLYADFTGTGKHYQQFPDRDGFRLYLTDLRSSAILDRLRAVWQDPLSLDPGRKRDHVTQDIAKLLARLVRSLEGPKQNRRNAPATVATFLMRCIFSMFAQSIGLLPKPDTFTMLLQRCKAEPVAAMPRAFVGLIGDLWRTMNEGGFFSAIVADIRHFNGGLFAPGDHGPLEPLRITADELDLLIVAAGKDWADVEPAIFGTLLENALDDPERAALGAHFTPRAFVERLVLPTIMEPLRTEWDGVKAAAVAEEQAGRREEAASVVSAFHGRLASVRVLDPACGSGNFLYVALELMKRLEGEVLDLLSTLRPGEGDRLALSGATVDPHNFLGLEKNPRAVPVAELVLWIGWLQWHTRMSGMRPPPEPILKDFRNVIFADALLNYSQEEQDRDKAGNPVTRWGGRTKLDPITGEEMPDETDQVLMLRPVGAKPAQWPVADFIVGNPPFIAGKDLRTELGSGYTEELWAAYPKVPHSADLALFFWQKGVHSVADGTARRFGFITSNSLRQAFCRRVIADALAARKPIHLVFAIPDHPWADGASTAAVRIAMTVAALGRGNGRLLTVVAETDAEVPEVTLAEQLGAINADLTVGASPDETKPLRANERIVSPGVKLHGAGFIVDPKMARSLGLGKMRGLEQYIRLYRNGRDLTGRSRDVMVIDLFGLAVDEVRRRYPAVFQHVMLHVKPERDAKVGNSADMAQYAREWWLHGKPRPQLRSALAGLTRYIATVETAKHRIFQFLSVEVLPDNRLICIATESAFQLGVLSSNIHVRWALAAGGLLEDRPIYTKTLCFDPFPFPDATPNQQLEIAALAEELDGLRKRVLAAHSFLTLTLLYNVLEKLRAGAPLTPAERDAHDAGQVSILYHLHTRLDEAVAVAYGWPATLSAPEIVTRVVALNALRAAEEAEGHVRWLRPEYQAPEEARRHATQGALAVDEVTMEASPWPKSAPAQYVALRAALSGGPATPSEVARHFKKAPVRRLREMLRTLTALGQAREAPGGRFTA
jgi:hypothetical protein